MPVKKKKAQNKGKRKGARPLKGKTVADYLQSVFIDFDNMPAALYTSNTSSSAQ